MKKLTLFTLLLCFAHAEKVEIGNIAGISLDELKNSYIVTYNPKTNALDRSYYFIKNGQLFKEKDKTIYPTNKLHSKSYRLFTYKKELENIGCKEYRAKDCIMTYIPTKRYFEYDTQKVYILPDNKSKIYNIIKYNYNKTL